MKTGIQSLQIPGAIHVGGGARHRAGEIARGLGAHRILIITDPGVINFSLHRDIQRSLEASDCEVRVFSGVQPDPTDANVCAGMEMARGYEPDMIVAIGGGSPIDCAKALAIAMRQGTDFSSWMGIENVPGPGLPLMAVPTTAGTGSEVTKVAVITNTSRQVKMMMLSGHLLPAVALVDHELSMGMPRPLTAAVGVDTLTHGIEAYVSAKAGGLTDPIALSCIKLCGRYLRRAWHNGNDREARAGMMLAATQGGMAFSNSSVALVHGMSRPIGAIFHLPHGLSNAVLLPAVTRWSISGAPERYAKISRVLGAAEAKNSDAAASDKLVSWVEALNEELEIPRLGSLLGEHSETFEKQCAKMAEDALASGSPGNNPRIPNVSDIKALYKAAW